LFPAVGAGAWVVQTLLAGTRLPLATVVLVATLSGAALAALAVLVTVAATYTAFRVGANPDDVVLPVVTNTCDVLGVLVLFAVVRLLV
jgi:mgtE-like transporter